MHFYTLNQNGLFSGIQVLITKLPTGKKGYAVVLGQKDGPRDVKPAASQMLVPLSEHFPPPMREDYTASGITIQVVDEGDIVVTRKTHPKKCEIGRSLPHDKRALIRSYPGPLEADNWHAWYLKRHFGEGDHTITTANGYSPQDGKSDRWIDELMLLPAGAAVSARYVDTPRMVEQVIYNTGDKLWQATPAQFLDFVRLWKRSVDPEKVEAEYQRAMKAYCLDVAEALKSTG